MKCPRCNDGDLIVTLSVDFTITDELGLRVQTIQPPDSVFVVCDRCFKDCPDDVRSNIDMVVLSDVDAIEQRIKEAINEP